MSKKLKRLEELRSGSKNIDFDDFVKALEDFGYTLRKIEGSHHKFKHPTAPSMIIQPKKGKAQLYQIKAFLEIVDSQDLEIETGED